MAVKSSALNVTDLDFDDISQNLKSYLKGQDSLKDYDFEGSTLSMLIDLLAYSSHIGAVNTNIENEYYLGSMFITKSSYQNDKFLNEMSEEHKSQYKTTLDIIDQINTRMSEMCSDNLY